MQKIKLGALLTLFIAAIVSTNASADGENILTVNADVTTKLSLILSQQQMNFTFEDGAFQSSNVTITGSTNSSRGYKISVQANLPYTELKHQKVTILDNIPAIAEPLESSAFPESGWGYSTDATLFKPLTIEPATAFETAVNGRIDHTFSTGIKASTTLPAGIYSNELLFSIVANPTATSLEMAYEDSGAERVTVGNGEYFTMQDMTPLICAMVDDIPSEIQAVDVRDNKLYWITKLADGHCWMTQNLDFDLDANVALTSDTTNLKTVSSWTPSVSTTTVDGAPGVTWPTEPRVDPRSLEIGDNYQYGNSSALRNVPYDESGQHGHVGNIYTWMAAIATNDGTAFVHSTMGHPERVPQDSICPKGWRLPTITDSDHTKKNSDNEFARLNYLYNEDSSTSNTGLYSAPLYFTTAGFGWEAGYYGGVYGHPGRYGEYWASTHPESDMHSYYVEMDSSLYTNSFSQLINNDRYDGKSIRCIAE